MGLFWDLLQQSQISEQRSRADSLDQRVADLENDLYATRKLLHKLVMMMEDHFGKDIDEDGKVG